MHRDHLAEVFIAGAILSMLLMVGILFLILYGIFKKKKAFWLTGTLLAVVWLFLYLFLFSSRSAEAVDATKEAQLQSK
ncbi:MAG: hypothetical protein HY062_04600 [Bacteroidetes bacterium]|nr:hypothetical protein [Bacteroidota bacterium]